MSITHNRPWTTVILFQGSDLDPLADRAAAYRRALVERVAAKSSAPLRVGDEDPDAEDGESSPLQRAALEYDEYADASIERGTHVRLAAVARKVYGALLAEHPPRQPLRAVVIDNETGETTPGEVVEGYEQDGEVGFDVDGIAEPLILGCLRAWDGWTDPDGNEWTPVRPDDEARQFDTDADLVAFVDGLSEPEFSRLFSAAVQLNRGGGPDPKVRLSSLLDRMSSAT